jgi:signal transduction histidine kinase
VGLRPRLLAALLLTSVVTLGVAALALLSPLEQRLREDGESRVLTAVGAARPEFAEIEPDSVSGGLQRTQLEAAAGSLRRRSQATVAVLNSRLDVEYSGENQSQNVPDYFAQARQAFASGRRVNRLNGNELVVAYPLIIAGHRYVLVLTRRLDYVASAFGVVRNAFLEGAAAGLAIALLLGIGLTSRLLRRLERLRDATRELERRGLQADPLPQDDRRDEIGELARAFGHMQARLRRQEAARRAFVATASHELRTPLASLDGTLELLEDDLANAPLDIDDARQRTARAREQSRRLSQLASDLLDLSRLDAEVALRSEPLELGELARAVAAEFELAADSRQVRIDVRPPARPSWAQADPGAVARIVRILIDNALRVAPAGSEVELSTDAAGNRAWISVQDAGPGVPESERELIFERFQRGSTTAGRSGFGLGLAIGRELAQRMGGSLVLDGPAAQSADLPGGGRHADVRPAPPRGRSGARFELRLPAAVGAIVEEHAPV